MLWFEGRGRRSKLCHSGAPTANLEPMNIMPAARGGILVFRAASTFAWVPGSLGERPGMTLAEPRIVSLTYLP